MKKLFILAIVFLLIGFTAYSLDLYVGGTFGGSVGWLNGSDWIDGLASFGAENKCRLGYSIGVSFELCVLPSFSLQPEVLLSSQGGAYEYNIGFNVDGKVKASLVEIPIYIKPKFKMGSGVFHLLLAPEFLIFLTDLKYKESGGGTTVESELTPDNKFVFGINGCDSIVSKNKIWETLVECYGRKEASL